MLSLVLLLQDDKQVVSYDVESLFTNIPIEETINYINKQIYVHQCLMPICLNLTFIRLLTKIRRQYVCWCKSKFLKQMYGCSMGGHLHGENGTLLQYHQNLCFIEVL